MGCYSNWKAPLQLSDRPEERDKPLFGTYCMPGTVVHAGPGRGPTKSDFLKCESWSLPMISCAPLSKLPGSVFMCKMG